jgi:hypothetical protein
MMPKSKFKFVADDVRNIVIEECAKCIPTTWLDPLLSGPEAVPGFAGAADRGAFAAHPGSYPQPQN